MTKEYYILKEDHFDGPYSQDGVIRQAKLEDLPDHTIILERPDRTRCSLSEFKSKVLEEDKEDEQNPPPLNDEGMPVDDFSFNFDDGEPSVDLNEYKESLDVTETPSPFSSSNIQWESWVPATLAMVIVGSMLILGWIFVPRHVTDSLSLNSPRHVSEDLDNPSLLNPPDESVETQATISENEIEKIDGSLKVPKEIQSRIQIAGLDGQFELVKALESSKSFSAQQYKEVLKNYRDLAERGSQKAKQRLAIVYLRGELGCDIDLELAKQFCDSIEEGELKSDLKIAINDYSTILLRQKESELQLAASELLEKVKILNEEVIYQKEIAKLKDSSTFTSYRPSRIAGAHFPNLSKQSRITVTSAKITLEIENELTHRSVVCKLWVSGKTKKQTLRIPEGQLEWGNLEIESNLEVEVPPGKSSHTLMVSLVDFPKLNRDSTFKALGMMGEKFDGSPQVSIELEPFNEVSTPENRKLGAKFRLEKKWDNAAHHFKSIVKRFPKSMVDWIQLSECYLYANKWPEAESAIRVVSQSNDHRSQAYLMLSHCFFCQNRLQEAEEMMSLARVESRQIESKIKVDPLFENLRDNPDFKTMLDQVFGTSDLTLTSLAKAPTMPEEIRPTFLDQIKETETPFLTPKALSQWIRNHNLISEKEYRKLEEIKSVAPPAADEFLTEAENQTIRSQFEAKQKVIIQERLQSLLTQFPSKLFVLDGLTTLKLGTYDAKHHSMTVVGSFADGEPREPVLNSVVFFSPDLSISNSPNPPPAERFISAKFSPIHVDKNPSGIQIWASDLGLVFNQISMTPDEARVFSKDLGSGNIRAAMLLEFPGESRGLTQSDNRMPPSDENSLFTARWNLRLGFILRKVCLYNLRTNKIEVETSCFAPSWSGTPFPPVGNSIAHEELFQINRLAEYRTWTSGQHTTKAKLIRCDRSKVSLRLDDGRKVVVDIKKIDEEDRKYIASLMSKVRREITPRPGTIRPGSRKRY